MILRRLTKHVNEQNWFAVVLDMLVVIIGIFVGLQISNLNVERQNIAKGHNYLERIAVELEQDIRFFDSSLRINQASIENGEFILQTLNDENLVRDNPTKFIQTINRLGITFRTNVSDNTFEEIKFSGSFQLIDDQDLRNQITDYYDFIEMERNWAHMRILMETTYFKLNVGILKMHQMTRISQDDVELYSAEEALEAYHIFKNKVDLIQWIPAVINAKRQSIFFDQLAQKRAVELLAKITMHKD